MSVNSQIKIIVLTLLVLGFGSAIYKHQVLGFSFSQEEQVKIWTVEAEISYEAQDKPVTVSLNLPDSSNHLDVVDIKNLAPGYDYKQVGDRGIWTSAHKTGEERIYLQAVITRDDQAISQPFLYPKEELSGAIATAVDELISQTGVESSKLEKSRELLSLLNSTTNQSAALLRNSIDVFGSKVKMAASVLDRAGITARPMLGIQLYDQKRQTNLQKYIEIKGDTRTILLDITTAREEDKKDILIWQQSDASMLDITGGTNGKVSFSVITGKVAAERLAVMNGKQKQSVLIDFSIYSLPIKDQNTFKLLLLIPIGALVVVILRNLIGITTSGTFMPILIAMVFLQTSLLSGLALFLVIVSIGLILRAYLTHLNLLLVPRISAVLVFVIIIYVAISVISVKLNFAIGLQVTFFPMIIISWTIERMSILWEEEGPIDVFKQGGGSLFAASLIYFAMSNSYLGHLAYSFPELLLVVLAVIIMIGSYSGYRLSELRRFEPLIKEG